MSEDSEPELLYFLESVLSSRPSISLFQAALTDSRSAESSKRKHACLFLSHLPHYLRAWKQAIPRSFVD